VPFNVKEYAPAVVEADVLSVKIVVVEPFAGGVTVTGVHVAVLAGTLDHFSAVIFTGLLNPAALLTVRANVTVAPAVKVFVGLSTAIVKLGVPETVQVTVLL
jgi:hypothetical protein